MFGRKREMAQIQAEREQALEALHRADSISTEVESRRGPVESLASTLRDRRTRNGFGADFQITLARRG